ncbi:4a-hydroxytetrahydrobiopterin dehydratase [Streptomyces sp. HNM0574]|uniref:4a-hydroxytetrahydrobiopterin dehydratase n=1 Tax=Streptomyces sp. HNM0574 TaxID=2714954 RepID=UPI00146E48DC|nr:4a-hydroxytetrahydrobiopterin dehydratase [Streptomyces sp. HNM0574]NLU66073.1 4a-hydroxytetrahydrobiopterin dehydratase [Streptomyces sp. HNM0574]
MPPEPLTDQELQDALAGLPGWTLEGDRIARTYSFGGHLPAAAMVIHVAAIQEELGHHSDLELGYNKLTVSVNTHSIGGRVTALDTGLARRIEDIAPGHGAR